MILFVVDDATASTRDVVAETPFTVEVRTVPDVASTFVVDAGEDVPEIGGSHSGVPDAFIVRTVPDAPGVGKDDEEVYTLVTFVTPEDDPPPFQNT